MLFSKEHFGKPISEELSKILSDRLHGMDYMEVEAYFKKIEPLRKASRQTLRKVVQRERNLSLHNAEPIKMLARIAFSRKRNDEDYLLEAIGEPEDEIMQKANQVTTELELG